MTVIRQWPTYFIGRILPACIGFFAIALYTHKVDPASFGTYTLLLAICFFVGTTLSGGLRVSVLRMLGTVEDADLPDFTATVIAIFIGASALIAIIITIALRIALPATSPLLIALTALAAISNAWFELNIVACQARLYLTTYGVLQGARSIATLIATLSILKIGGNVEALLGGYVLGNCVALGTAYNFRAALRGRPNVAAFKRIFHFGWPTSVASLSGISVTVQKFVLQSIGGSAALGIYSVANDFAGQSVGLLIGTAAITGQPLAFRARDKGDDAALFKQLHDNARLIFGVGIGAAVGLAALSSAIAKVSFGAKFHENAWQLISLASATAFVSGIRASIFEQGFEIVLRTRPLAVLPWIRVVLYIPLSAIFITKAGSIGAGFAALLTEIVVFSVTAIWVRKMILMPIPWATILRLIVAAGGMAFVVQFIPSRDHPLGLALVIFTGAATYAAICFMLFMPEIRRSVRIHKELESVAEA